MTQAEYARHAKVSREGVRKMIEAGRIPFVEEGGKKLIDPVEADRARGANMARILAEAADDADDASPASPAKSSGLTAAKTEREGYLARLAEVELNERLAKLRPVEEFVSATQRCAEHAIRSIERIAARADELTALVQKDGVSGARSCLRSIARELRSVMSAEFSKLASGELVKQVVREAEIDEAAE